MGKTNIKFLLLITIVVAITAVVVYQKQRRETGKAFEPHELFPELNIEAIARVEIVKPEETIEFQKLSDDAWGMVVRHDYPVDPEQLRRLIFKIKQLRVADRMTSKPEKYERLGVGEPPETATIHLYDSVGEELAGLIIGSQRYGQASGPGGQGPRVGQYVRVIGDPVVYVTGGASRFVFEEALPEWLQHQVLNVEPEELASISIENQGTTDSLTITHTGDDPFSISGPAPQGWKIKTSLVAGVGRSLRDLRIEDVIRADAPEAAAIVYGSTFTGVRKNGLIYEIGAGQRDEDFFIRIAARYDSSLDLSLLDEPTSDTQRAKEMEPAEATAKELNERHAPWIYQVPSYNHDKFSKKFSDLFEEIPQPEPTTQPATQPMELPIVIEPTTQPTGLSVLQPETQPQSQPSTQTQPATQPQSKLSPQTQPATQPTT